MTILSTDINLQQFAGPVFDQLSYGSCYSNALCGAITLEANEEHIVNQALSRAFEYDTTRIGQGTFPTDSGSVTSYALNAAVKYGIPNESEFGYTDYNINNAPSAQVYTDAATQKVLSYTSLNIYLTYAGIRDEIKSELMQGKPVILSFNVRYWFYGEQGQLDQQVSHPPTSIDDTIAGGHAVLIVGANDSLDNGNGAYIVKNSWGTGWGDNGYGTISYQQFIGDHINDLIELDTINGYKGIDFTFTHERTQISELYVALLNRASDISGLDYWAGLIKGGTSASAICNYMLSCAEVQTIFPANDTASHFISTVYTTVLDRAPGTDAAGQAYWSSLINGGMSRGDVLENIIYSNDNYVSNPSSPLNSDALHSHDLFLNKVNAAMNTAVTYQINDMNADHIALVGVTDNANSIQTALNNVQHSLGWI